MAFLETPRFPDDISYNVTGGPMWITDIVTRSSGHEQRIGRWTAPLWRWPDVAHAARTASQLDTLQAFFLNVSGKLDGFRFKDWADYTVTTSNGILDTGLGDNTPTYQLIKKYTTGSRSYSRTISKPVSGTVSIYKNAVMQTAGASPGNYALDTTTGIVTFVADLTLTITGVTQANPGVVTYTGTDPANGNVVYISGVSGMTQLNGNYYTVANVNTGANTFELSGTNTTSYGAWTSGGSVARYPQASDTLTWAGEFDVPVRFDTDMMSRTIIAPGIEGWGNIPVVEIRL